jgi:Fe-Mn family superoxide dismutase
MYEVKPLKFDPKSLKGISDKQITLHHDKHYASYVNARNKIEETLAKQDFEHMRAKLKNSFFSA